MSTRPASSTTGSGSAPRGTVERGPAIDRVQVRLVDVPLGEERGGSGATLLQLVHVTITDDDGAVGTGFTYSLCAGTEAVTAMLAAVHVPVLRGLPTEHWDRVLYAIRDRTHRLGRGVTQLATSAVDIAVWDLRACRAGLPLYRMLGGQRDSVPVYGSGRATHAMSVDELIDGAQAYLDEGYSAIKLRAGVHPPATDVQRVAAVREAVGPDVAIMVDCNERLDPAGAQWLAHRFADLGVSWLEEPLPASDVAGHRALAARSPVPLAVGEHLQGLGEFVPYADPAVVGVLQPDAPLTGGISEFLRIATLAEANGLAVSPHFLPELHVHLAAACRTATWIEHFPLIDDLLGELLPVRGGRAAVPQRPGHGMVWDDHALQRYTRQRMDTVGST